MTKRQEQKPEQKKKQPSKYVAKDAIGNNIRSSRPMFAKGAEVPDNHPELEKWKQWGMLSENPARKISDEAEKAAQAQTRQKPHSVPVFPIKRDVDNADYSLETPESARARVEAESMESITGEERKEKEAEADAKAAEIAAQPAVTKTTTTETVKPHVARESDHGKSNMDDVAVKEDKQDALDAGGETAKAVKEVAKEAEEVKKEKTAAKEADEEEEEDEEEEDEEEEEETPAPKKASTTAAKKTTTASKTKK